MTTPTNDIQRQLEFQRQSRRLSRATQKPAEQQFEHLEEDVKIHKQLLKKAIAEKDIPVMNQHGDKLIELLAKKTSIHIYELHKRYKNPPKSMIKKLAKQYTKEAVKIKIIIEKIQNYGDTTR